MGYSALAAHAQLYGRVERKLFADFSAGEVPASLKKGYLERYGIPARMFNGLRVSLEGKVLAVQKTMGLRLDNLQRRIARAELEIAKAVERGRLNQVHQKKRRLANLRFTGWLHWKPTLLRAESGCASGRSGCGASSMQSRGLMATAAIRSGSGTGGIPGATSFSYWAAGMKRRVANYASPMIAEDGSLNLRVQDARLPWQSSMGSTC